LDFKRLFVGNDKKSDTKTVNILRLKRIKQHQAPTAAGGSRHQSSTSNETGSQLGVMNTFKSMRIRRRQTVIYYEQAKDYFNSLVIFLHKQNYLLTLLSMMVDNYAGNIISKNKRKTN
jgi:hypothetical protein